MNELQFPVEITSDEGSIWHFRSDDDGDWWVGGLREGACGNTASEMVGAIKAEHWLWPPGSATITQNAKPLGIKK